MMIFVVLLFFIVLSPFLFLWMLCIMMVYASMMHMMQVKNKNEDDFSTFATDLLHVFPLLTRTRRFSGRHSQSRSPDSCVCGTIHFQNALPSHERLKLSIVAGLRQQAVETHIQWRYRAVRHYLPVWMPSAFPVNPGGTTKVAQSQKSRRNTLALFEYVQSNMPTTLCQQCVKNALIGL